MKKFSQVINEDSRDGYGMFMDLSTELNEVFDSISILIGKPKVVSYADLQKIRKIIADGAKDYVVATVKAIKDPEIRQHMKEYLGGYMSQARTFGMSKPDVEKLLKPL